MDNETEKMRAELSEFVSNCEDEAFLKEMLRVIKEEMPPNKNH